MGDSIRTREQWRAIATAVFDPAGTVTLPDKDFDALLSGIEANGLLPFFAREMRNAGAWDGLPQGRRDRLSAKTLHYKAASAIMWQSIEAVLTRFQRESLHPVLLKGAHTAMTLYEEPYLRPMFDVDILFTDLREADRSLEVLRDMGLLQKPAGPGRNPWDWDRDVWFVNERTHFNVEIHGDLLFPPTDRRSRRGRVLLEGLREFRHGDLLLRALSTEAELVFALIHVLRGHADHSPRLVSLLDAERIARGSVDWPGVVGMASACGFSGTLAEGFHLLEDLFGVSIPADIAESVEGERDEVRLLAGHGGAPTSEALAVICRSSGPRVAARRAWSLAFPPGEYMRLRYPDGKARSLARLYLRRWTRRSGGR